MSSNGNTRVFGQAMRRGGPRGGRGGTRYGGGASSRYQRQMGQTGGGKRLPPNLAASVTSEEDAEAERARRAADARRRRRAEGEEIDARFGYHRFDRRTSSEESGARIKETRRGWVFNMLSNSVQMGDDSGAADGTSGTERAAVDLYMITDSGSTFKCTVLHDPYFYVLPKARRAELGVGNGSIGENGEADDDSVYLESLRAALLREYEGRGLRRVDAVKMEDLDETNHLGHGKEGRAMLKLVFDNVQQLTDIRRDVLDAVKKNQKKEEEADATLDIFNPGQISKHDHTRDPLSVLVDAREYDVPYLVRVCTDLDIRAGAWYTVTPNAHDVGCTLSDMDAEKKAEPTFLAFDIECTKAPLKFPDADVDSIFMISYMVGGQGHLILSRHVVGQDVDDFEYTPKPSYPGPFKIHNERTEEDLIRRFLSEYQKNRPQIVVTYNGDFFDWPFLESRAARYGLDLRTELGVERVGENGEYRGRTSVHLDAFHWVQRDSYLPQGSQGLKAVTKYKLGYDPVEVDPEDMVRFAQERPTHMASYSVSDAVATYYLYEKYVHLFIFSLCTLIPMGPEDVLRKGSGTLCESLLMVQACKKSIVCPNKQVDPPTKFHQGHLLESETYIGGKVECLETGVYRSDIEYKFDMKPSAYQGLINNVDRDLTFAIEVEGGMDRNRIVNYDEIRNQIIESLEMLRDRPKRIEKPFVYHLDVGAMYPNIILTNRLQPSAIVDDATCAACDFNRSRNGCKRKMNWVWRGDYSPAGRAEYEHVKDQLSRETMADGRTFRELDEREQALAVAGRLKSYSKNAYKKTKVTEEVTRTDTVCMRENPFYVDTVRQFRDRRYDYKKLTKVWKKRISSACDAASKKEAEDRALVYDSLQVAHKCILNSFYGYVMRKGARWRSMPMAGIVTKTGADLITQARILVEQIGRPLELDTDGIWCILPQSFPDVYFFQTTDGTKFKLEYPCVMLNADVHDKFTNHQYQTLTNPASRKYETRSENSIFFEVDGPYRAMIIPSSTEEGKLLKKRYAVFNFDGSLAELKGFELKRRGELELIKTFQSQVFERFLDGDSLVECYDSVAEIANHWMDVLDTRGESLETDEVVDLISENRSMSKQLDEYGDQKGTSQTTARRLGEFLGAEIIKDKGLNCKFIIAERPHGAPVTERAIPTAIWKAEPAVMKHFLRKWLKSPGMEDEDFDIRSVLDWDYYRDRLGKTIQKIVTIPAALQNVPNPVPRVRHPNWLERTVRRLNDRHKQQRITSMFEALPASGKAQDSSHEDEAKVLVADMEDAFGGVKKGPGRPVVHISRRRPGQSSKGYNGKAGDSGAASGTSLAMENTPAKVVLTEENFNKWLSRKKMLWRNARKRNRDAGRPNKGAGFSEAGIGDGRPPASFPLMKKRRAVESVAGFIRDAASSLQEHEWHIVEIRERSSTDGGSIGEFMLWVMVENSLQRVDVTVPRSIFVDCSCEIMPQLGGNIQVRKIEKHLPHNKAAKYLYEVTMQESIYQSTDWMDALVPVDKDFSGQVVRSLYGTSMPLMLTALTELGCVSRVNGASKGSMKGSYNLTDLQAVLMPKEGEYLHRNMLYRRIFLYESLHPKSKTGLIAVFIIDGKAGENYAGSKNDVTRPSLLDEGSLLMKASCHMWVVKPGASKELNNISSRRCEEMFSVIVQQIREVPGDTSDYSCLSLSSECSVNLKGMETEKSAWMAVDGVLNSHKNQGPTFLLVNTNTPMTYLRKALPSCTSFPLVIMPFPPGPQHNPSVSARPSLNWEPLAAQLCFESYLYMGIVSFPKRAASSRYGNIPIGNLGDDDAITMYDITFSRQLKKSRMVPWASQMPGHPDLGCSALSLMSGSLGPVHEDLSGTSEDMWGDDDEQISPVVRRPGAYRQICVEIDIHDLSVAAITDVKLAALSGEAGSAHQQRGNSMVGIGAGALSSAPLGDEMSTAVSLPLLRALVQNWLRDAQGRNSLVADDLLHHFHRLVCSPEALFNDPALHRIVHSLMKSTFLRLLSEFQRLGSTIICATFNRIIVSTNKTELFDAKEYIDFVISTILKGRAESEGGLARISLQPNNFYTHYLFLDEHNFGGIHFEQREIEEEEEGGMAMFLDENGNDDPKATPIVPTVISGWNVMHFLAGEISQEYFQALIGRFSKDVYRKQEQIKSKLQRAAESPTSVENIPEKKAATGPSASEQLVKYKKKLISKHFASYLTRAVGEIVRDGGGPESFPKLPGSHLPLTSPALEFIKNILVILELDTDVEHEVHILRKSLLSQIGVPEFSSLTKWKNPCASFVLPDVFCSECHESHDLDLCVLPSPDEEQTSWECYECGNPYDTEQVERRLVGVIQRKSTRFQLQDLRCSKTERVATRSMAKLSECSAPLKPDISKEEFTKEMHILRNLAKFHRLEWLLETTNGLIKNYSYHD